MSRDLRLTIALHDISEEDSDRLFDAIAELVFANDAWEAGMTCVPLEEGDTDES
jgi:hypothetical protein